MTTYKEIFGKPVKVLSTDPTSVEAEGQVWYNSTAGVFKTVLATGGWVSGGNLNRGTTAATEEFTGGVITKTFTTS